MTKDLKIVIRVDTKTGELKVLTNELDNVTAKANEAKSAFGSIKGKLLALGSAAASIYSISQAFGFVLSSGLEYNKQMDASRAKLRAMISTQKDYITLTGQKVSAMQREKLITQELNATMTLLKRANAQTAMGMSELIDVYALAKPGMDRANWSLKDQIEILKLVTNTASNFGVSAEELSTGIDDLATGTWDASSGFGKMMKALGITNESFKAAANKVEFLKEKLKETGAVQDTWAVATSNLGVAWDELTGKITAPIFDIAKEGVKELTLYLNGIDSSSVDGVRDSLIAMAKVGVKSAAYLAMGINGISASWNATKAAFALFVIALGKGLDYTLRAISAAWQFIEESGKALWIGLKIAFWGLPLAIGKGINSIHKDWQEFTAGLQNAFKIAIDFIGKSWYSFVNFLLKGVNKFINALSAGLGKGLDFLGIENPFKPINLSIGEYVSSIKEAKAESKDLIDLSYLENQLNSATKEVGNFKSKVAETFSKKIVKTPWSEELFKNSVANVSSSIDNLIDSKPLKAADEFIAKIDKIANRYKKVNKEQKKTSNTVKLANKKVSTPLENTAKKAKKAANALKKLKHAAKGKGLDNTSKKAKKASSSLKKLKSSAKSAKDYLDGLKKAKDILFEATHSKSEVELKKLNEEMANLGKYLDKSDIDKIYQAKIRKMQGFTKEFTDDFKNAFNSVLNGDIKGGIEGLLKSLSSKLMNPLITNVSNSINSWFSSLTGSMGMFEQFGMGGLLSIGGSLISSLFEGHKLTQAEIDAAKGRVDFSDESLQKLSSYLEKFENPLLPYTKDMRNYLQNMDKNFLLIGEALVGSDAVYNFNGSGYAPTNESGFLGFSSTQSSLIGSGIYLNNLNLKNPYNLEAIGYTTEKVHEESFWGLFSDDYIKESKKALDKETTEAFIDILQSGKNAIISSANLLGYDVEKEIENFKLDLGKINLQDLDAKGAADRINAAFSEFFSKAIDSTSLSSLVDKYKQGNEKALETLGRIGVEFEQASFTLENAGFKFEDTIKEQTVKFTGLFGELINKTFEVILQDTYTAQEKILDIVEASGGLEKFNTNFSSFINNFYTDEEKLKLQENSLSSQFSSLNITLPKTEDEFKNLVQSFEVVDESSAKAWASLLSLSDSFKEYSDLKKQLEDEALEEQKNRLQDLISWQKDINKKIADAWMGSLSYLSSAEKEIKAKEIAEAYLLSGDVTSYLDMRAKELEFSRTKSSTQEEYAIAFNRYINDVKNAKQDSSTLDDVVKSIDELKEELAKLQNENNQIASNSSINTIKKLDALIEAEKETKKAIEDERVVV